MSNLNSPPIVTGPITAADLDRATNTGRIFHLHRVTLAPAGCDQQGALETRRWRDSMLDSAYGREGIELTQPRIVPCSTVARVWLALRRWLLG